MHSDGFYLHQWLSRLHALEMRLSARLPAESVLPARAKALHTQVAQALAIQTDEVLDGLIETVFLPQLNRLLQEVRGALQLTQHARGVKKAITTPRQARLLQLSATVPDAPDVLPFQNDGILRRHPDNQEKIEEALLRLKEFLSLLTKESS